MNSRGIMSAPGKARNVARTVPKTAKQANSGCCRFLDHYQVRIGQDGIRGLFARTSIAENTYLARYDGAPLMETDVGDMTESHMLRVPGSSLIIDAKPLADCLVYDKERDLCLPGHPDLYKYSYAGLANAADTENEANARMVFCVNDYLEAKEQRDLSPPVAFLVAKRALEPGEEVLWHYHYRKAEEEAKGGKAKKAKKG